MMTHSKILVLLLPAILVLLFACHKEPTADFTISKINATSNDTILFTNLTTDADHYDWHFGDGSTSDKKNPSHLYTKTGEYIVTLIVYNADGKRSKPAIQKITIALSPICAFTFSPRYPKPGESVHFIDNSTNNPGSWLWDFGDGTTSTEKVTDHIFSLEKTYLVSLKVSNEYSSFMQTDSVFVMNHVPIAPIPNFSSTFSPGFIVHFQDESTNYPNRWIWDFGDGSTSTLQNPVHQYSTGGAHRITFRAFNLAGSNQLIRMINIPNNIPEAKFIYSEGSNFTINFEDNSINDPEQWEWSFGDGATSTLQNPSHQYLQAGNYNVTLKVTNQAGYDQITEMIYVSNFNYTFFIGNYEVLDEGVGTSITYHDQITATEQTNMFNTGRFGNYENAIVYYTVSGTTLTIPAQTVHCDTPPNDLDHTFNGLGYFEYLNGTVKLFIEYNDVSTLGNFKHTAKYTKLK